MTTTADRTAEGVDAIDIEATGSGDGYWVLFADGTVEAKGDAAALGGATGGGIGGLARTASGQGYWIVAREHRVTTRGDAPA